MSIDTIRTKSGGPTTERRVLDVSHVTAREVRAFVRAADAGDDVYLERRGGRTYLLAEATVE